MDEKKDFWRAWFKFVGVLILIFLVWLVLIFVCERIFGKTFENLKYIHYFILLVVILKAKKWFLKEIDFKRENYEEKEREKNKLKKL